MTFSDHVIRFYHSLKLDSSLPDSIHVLNPFDDSGVQDIVDEYYSKYYSDENNRIFIFGINPGRFGAGITGIPFTDPIRLDEVCKIKNNFKKVPELSSVFVYETIKAYGGIKKFTTHFYITAVCPLGFMRDQKNMNYYDDKKLQSQLAEFIVTSISKQIAFGTSNRCCICFGEGKNFEYLSKLNEEQKFFSEIIPLPHPRWIMQYRRKKMQEYIELFVQTLKEQRRFLS